MINYNETNKQQYLESVVENICNNLRKLGQSTDFTNIHKMVMLLQDIGPYVVRERDELELLYNLYKKVKQ